jgi:hypothetical protein
MTIDTKPSKVDLEKELDEALKGTFPASDPMHVGEATAAEPDRPVGRRPAKIDKALVDKLAREVDRKHKGSA